MAKRKGTPLTGPAGALLLLGAKAGGPCEIPRLALRPRKAAAALGISERTLWSLTDPRGAIPCVRIGRAVRYDPRDLVAWIERQKARPGKDGSP